MAWEENPRICLHMQLIAILSRTGVNRTGPGPTTAPAPPPASQHTNAPSRKSFSSRGRLAFTFFFALSRESDLYGLVLAQYAVSCQSFLYYLAAK